MKLGASQHSREEWLAERRGKIGASQAAALMGESPWSTPLQVYLELRGELPPQEDTERLAWGRRLEAAVLDAYGELRYAGRHVEPCGRIVYHPTLDRVIATPDALTTFADDLLELVPLEAKTAHAGALDEWQDGPPRHYWWQLQHQMMVCGSAWASIACLFGGQTLRWCDVSRDDAAIRRLEAACVDMLRRADAGDPPPATRADAQAVALAYPEAGGEVALPGDLIDVVRELDALKAQERAIAEQRAALEVRIKEALGTHSSGHLADGTTITWKTQERAEHVVRASKSRVLRIVKKKEAT